MADTTTSLSQPLTKDLILQPNSRLLQLSFEIREMIWTYLCGEKTIHIINAVKKPEKFTHSLCRSSDAEEAIYKRFMNRGGEGGYSVKAGRVNLPEYQDPMAYHTSCGVPNEKYKLDLTFLRTCKQIHHEARLMPYSTNTFSFNEPEMLERFVKFFPQQHRAQVRRIQVYARLHWDGDERPWQDVISTRLAPNFQHIQHLNLAIALGFPPCWMARQDDRRGLHQSWMRAVLTLKGLSLKTATVMISENEWNCHGDYHSKDVHEQGKSWSHRRRREVRQDMAERIRKELLAPNGANMESTQ